MKLSLCLNALFAHLSIENALRSAREIGFDTVECWQIPTNQTAVMAEGLAREQLSLSAFCPDYFTLNDPSCRERYLAGIQNALPRAKSFGCDALITQVGQETKAPRAVQHEAIVEGLRAAAPLLEEADVTLLVEPLNSKKDHEGYYLTSSQEGFDIIREVDSPRVRLLYDLYHQLHMGEDVLKEIEAHINLIGHFHVAGFPHRDECLFEGYDYTAFFNFLMREGIETPIGVELFPSSAERLTVLLRRLIAFC